MHYQNPQQQKMYSEIRNRGVENTTESGYAEMIYMEPNQNQMISSPVTEGRQTGGQTQSTRSPTGTAGRNMVISARRQIIERPEITGQITTIGVVIPQRGGSNDPRREERSPKTINIGDTEQQTEYNIRTLNARRSPGQGGYQTYTNAHEQSLPYEQPVQYASFIGPDGNAYPAQNDSNVMVTSMGGQIKQSGYTNITSQVSGTMGPRDGREPLQTVSKMSPNKNVDDINSSGDKGYDSQSQLNNLKNHLVNNVPIQNEVNAMAPGAYNKNDINQIQAMINSGNLPQNGEMKDIIKRFTKVYDPLKTKEGNLISENQKTYSGVPDEIFQDRHRVLQKMNKLSTILLSKNSNKGSTLDRTVNPNLDEPSRKTFNRETLSRGDPKAKKVPLNRSPEQRFLYVSLAMLSSKGPNCEDRTMLRKYRFDKGGVVDLAQEEAKRGKYTVKKVRRGTKAGTKALRPNPKFREKAAKTIQAWWRELKERYDLINKKIILIQSCWRGKWVRKYMYDILYLSLMYQSFCQIIQKVLVNHIRPWVMFKLFERQQLLIDALRSLILKEERFKALQMKPYWDRWREYVDERRKIDQERQLIGKGLIDIRSVQDDRLSKLRNALSKWRYINKVSNTNDVITQKDNEKRRYFGLITLMNGSDKAAKRAGLKTAKPQIEKYLDDQLRQKAITNLLHANPKFKKILMRNYMNKWKSQVHKLTMKDMRDKIVDKMLGGMGSKLQKKVLKRAFQQWWRNLPKNTEIDFYNGSVLLRKAVLRKTYKDPLNAIKEKEDSNNLQDSIMRLLGVKSRYIKYHWRDYLLKWKQQAQKTKDNEIKNKLYLSLLDTMFTKRKHRILSNRFNHWRKAPKVNMAEVFERFRSMITCVNKIVDKNLLPRKRDFLNNLKKQISPTAYKKAVDTLLEKYLHGNKNWMRYILYKWKDQCKNMEIYDLKLKLLQAQGGRNNLKNTRLRMSKVFNKWKYNTVTQKKMEDQEKADKMKEEILNKEYGTKLLKNLKNHFVKNDIDSRKRRVLDIWRNQVELINDKTKDNTDKATNNLKRFNTLKNAPTLFDKLKNKSTINKKRSVLKSMPGRYKKYERINLLRYFLKWKMKTNALKESDKHKSTRNKYIKTLITKGDKADMLRAFLKWNQNKPKVFNKFPIIVGTEQLHRALLRQPFKNFNKKTQLLNLKIPHGMSIQQALVRGNRNLAKSIVFRNILQRPHFRKWKQTAKHMSGDELRHDIFNKLIFGNLNKNKKTITRHFFNRWKDNVDDLQKKDLQKNLYMKLMGKMYDKGAKFALRKTFGKWKQNYQDYVKRLNDAGKATYKLRHFVTRPILDKFRKTIMNQGKFDKVKQMMINALRKNDHGNLTYIFNKWKNNANKLKELSIKGRLLKSLAKHNDYKNDDIRKGKLIETILRWRIKAAPRDSYEKLASWLKGIDKLKDGIKKPQNRNIFNNIKRKADYTRRNNLLYQLLNKLNPKLLNTTRKHYFDTWRDRVGDTEEMKKRLRKLLFDYLNKTRDDLISKPIHELTDAMKAYILLKQNKAKPIKDFCRGLLNIKRQMDILRRNILLKKLFNSLGVYTKVKGKQTLNKWLRNAKKGTTDDKADKIQNFLRSKLGNAGKKRKRIEDGTNILNKYILRNVLDKIKKDARWKTICRILLKLYNNKDQAKTKLLHNYFNKWRDILPELRRNDAATTIQTAFRGLNARNKVNKLRDRNRKLKYLILRLIGKEGDTLNIYFNKWLAQIQKENVKTNADKIQRFLNDKLNKLKKRKAQDKLTDLLRKYIIRQLTDAITKASKVNGDRGAILYKTLEDIYIRRPFNKLITALKWLSKINTLRKLHPKIQRALRLYWLPLYMKRWYDNTIEDRNRKILRIQNWFRGRLALWRRRAQLRREQLLAKFLQKLINDKDLMLRIPFKYWQKLTKYEQLNDQANTIQKIWKGWTSRNNVKRLLAQDKIKKLIKKSTKKQIADAIRDADDKFVKPLKKNLRNANTKPIDKRYATNNIVDFANDELRNKYLLYLTGKRDFANRLAFLRLYFDKWRDIVNKENDAANTIQKNFRGKLGRDKAKRLRRLKDLLYAMVMRLSDDDQSKLRSALRRWLNKAKAITCDEKSKVIQDFLGPRYKRLINSRIRNFFNNLADKLVKRRLTNAGKVNKLKDVIIKLLITEFIKRLINKDKWDKWRLFMAKRLHDIDGSLGDLIMKRYFDLWRKNAKKLSDLLNDNAEKIQRNYRVYLAKKLADNLRKRKAKLYKILMNLINDDELKKKCAFNLWRHNAKAMELDENSRIIQNFVGKILDKIKNKRNRTNLKNISKGLDILSNLKGPLRDGFNAIRSEANRKTFTKFVNDLDNKRKDHLKTAYDAIRDAEKDKLLNKLFNIPESARLRILKKWFDIWKDKADKLGRNWAARTIQRAWRNYITRRRFDKLNDRIKDLFIKLNEKYSNILAHYFNKWRTNVKKGKVLRAGKRINNFLERKLKDNRAKRNWHKLADGLNIKAGNLLALDLLDRLKKFMAINRMTKPIKHRFTKEGWDQFKDGLRWKELKDRLYLLFSNFDRRKELNSLKYYLRKWRDIKNRMNDIDDALTRLVEIIDTRQKIIAADTINNAFLVKKLFHDIPRIRALDFFNRLRNVGDYKKRLRDLGDTLVKAKDDLTTQNKTDLANKLYRLYTYVLLDRMMKPCEDLDNKLKRFYGKEFINKLKATQDEDQDYVYNTSKNGDKETPKTSLKFKARAVNPKTLPLKEEKKDINKILLPYLVDYLNKIFRKRKQEAMDKLKDNDRDGHFCRLYKNHTKKQMLPPKRELYDKLKQRSAYMDSYGDHIIKLFKLLRKYFIHKTCESLADPSRIYLMLYLIKILFMHKNIAKQRFIRELIRKWRFMSFVKKMARRKLELMYKNLHLSYLQMANEVFGDEDGVNPSIVQEFERFGDGMGMFVNENPNLPLEHKYSRGVQKQYIFEPVVIEKKEWATGEGESESSFLAEGGAAGMSGGVVSGGVVMGGSVSGGAGRMKMDTSKGGSVAKGGFKRGKKK